MQKLKYKDEEFTYEIVVNNQLSPNYANKSLCGAGIVYKFCEVLDKKLGVNYAQDYMDLAALGEIADVMDRTEVETNYIMLEGLKNIKNKGLKTLLEAQSYSLKDKAVPPYGNRPFRQRQWLIRSLSFASKKLIFQHQAPAVVHRKV